MRILFWYCEKFAWNPAIKTLDEYPDAGPGEQHNGVVAFIHVEPQDMQAGSTAETKLVKNAKWLARKWETKKVLLHSFTHLADAKAEPEQSKALFDRVQDRLQKAGYEASQTPFGFFHDLAIEAQGHPLARIFKSF
jgi:hypothetical protein